MQCVADKGEPLLSGFDHTREGLEPVMAGWGFEITHLLNPKCGPPALSPDIHTVGKLLFLHPLCKEMSSSAKLQ